MAQLSHRVSGATVQTVGALLARTTRQLARARLHYGHGTDNARDEAAALLAHAISPSGDGRLPSPARRVSGAAATRLQQLVQRRIASRIPAVYLTGRCWFAGLPMHVDQRVLIPRSPIAELIERRFEPWVRPEQVRRILDLGTGSGCIAVACARAFPQARVDASDVSAEALAVAAINIRQHRVQRRVRALRSDHFDALGRTRYDIIVSNPPYVGERELASLPEEYRHEPRLALAAGRDGLESVRILLREAAAHLTGTGVLIVEVGNSERALRRAFPRLPFVWLSFERGGGGVFLLERAALQQQGG